MIMMKISVSAIAALTLLWTAPGYAQGPSAAGAASATATKSAKRGIAYDLASPADMAALAAGVSW